MKKISKIFTITFIILGISLPAMADKVVALVNKKPILESQVLALTKTVTKKVALEQLIDQMLVEQFKHQYDIRATSEEIDRAIEDVMTNNGITYGELLDALDEQGISLDTFKQTLAKQIEEAKYKQALMSAANDISLEDVKTLAMKLKLNDKKKVVLPKVKEYKIRHILIKVTPIMSDQKAQEKLTAIREKIRQGASFKELAKKYSEDLLSGANSGDLGWVRIENYVPEFASVVFNSEINTISPLFKTQFGWHILVVENTREAPITEDEYYIQQAQQQLSKNMTSQSDKKFKQKLRAKASIVYLD